MDSRLAGILREPQEPAPRNDSACNSNLKIDELAGKRPAGCAFRPARHGLAPLRQGSVRLWLLSLVATRMCPRRIGDGHFVRDDEIDAIRIAIAERPRYRRRRHHCYR